MLTATRHDDADFSLLPALIPAVRSLLWSKVPMVPHQLPTLQAFAILCTWQLPESSMVIDPTYLLAGTLHAAATHVGLHRPDVLEHYHRTRLSLDAADIREAVRAWSCIFIAIEG